MDSALVEHRGVEVGVSLPFGQAEQGDLVIPGVDTSNGILPAFGHPGRAVGSNNDIVGCRPLCREGGGGTAPPGGAPPPVWGWGGRVKRAGRGGGGVPWGGGGGGPP